MKAHKISQAPIPMRNVGPIKITGPVLDEKISVPLATYETPLWPSVGRGARVSVLTEGIKTNSMSTITNAKGVESMYKTSLTRWVRISYSEER